MRALGLLLALLALAGWWYEPLVYERFEVKVLSGYGEKPIMVSRTCIFFSGHSLVEHHLTGEYQFSCPRRRGQISIGSPGLLVD